MRALGIAATGMQAQQTNVEVISNNIANVSTTGFKRGRAEFQDLLYQSAARVGTNSSETGTILPTGTQVGLGVRNSGTTRILTQGSLTQTDNKLDLAVDGRGYFGIQLPNGDTAYTRDGSFKLSPTGEIVTSQGFSVNPNISIDSKARDVTVNQAGEVIVTDANGKQQTVGRLQLFLFANEAGLDALGGNNFLETEASGTPTQGVPNDPGFGVVRQGYLETSNVNVVQEITSLIQAQRAYEMNSKVIEASDQMMQTTTQVR
ncbi:flagellar basal-body rod protein FlgG [Rhodovastum atsumiense]|uniref:flagellar basal-body rod protein FlgG n=1 Tax=Rhodovastum atsumiense TaxID=504468 RepID=UPI0020240DA3|nr:flagellar basal-body rod protein FlgG [Rhodovastum atsumiense]